MHRAVLLRVEGEWKEGIEIFGSRSLKDEESCYELEAKVSKDACAILQDIENSRSFVGLVRGLPVFLQVSEDLDEDGAKTFGIYVGWSSGGLPMSGQHSLKVVPTVKLATELKAPPVDDDNLEQMAYEEEGAVGWDSVLGSREAILSPTSDKFVDGVIKVHMNITSSPS